MTGITHLQEFAKPTLQGIVDATVENVIARNLTTGKFEPFTAAEGFDNFSVLEYGYDNDGVNDVIAGSVIVRGSVYEAKLADAVTDEFKALTPMIRYVSHK